MINQQRMHMSIPTRNGLHGGHHGINIAQNATPIVPYGVPTFGFGGNQMYPSPFNPLPAAHMVNWGQYFNPEMCVNNHPALQPTPMGQAGSYPLHAQPTQREWTTLFPINMNPNIVEENRNENDSFVMDSADLFPGPYTVTELPITAYQDIPQSLLTCHICTKNLENPMLFNAHLKEPLHHVAVSHLIDKNINMVTFFRNNAKMMEETRTLQRSHVTNTCYTCRVCAVDVFGSEKSHTDTTYHKQLVTFLKPKCMFCKLGFNDRMVWECHKLELHHLKKLKAVGITNVIDLDIDCCKAEENDVIFIDDISDSSDREIKQEHEDSISMTTTMPADEETNTMPNRHARNVTPEVVGIAHQQTFSGVQSSQNSSFHTTTNTSANNTIEGRPPLVDATENQTVSEVNICRNTALRRTTRQTIMALQRRRKAFRLNSLKLKQAMAILNRVVRDYTYSGLRLFNFRIVRVPKPRLGGATQTITSTPLSVNGPRIDPNAADQRNIQVTDSVPGCPNQSASTSLYLADAPQQRPVENPRDGLLINNLVPVPQEGRSTLNTPVQQKQSQSSPEVATPASARLPKLL